MKLVQDARRPLVLVVDDDPGLRQLIELLLQEEGFDVASAVDGSRALELAQAVNPDLIVLDVSMPGLDGFTVFRELQLLPTPVPVIFLSGHGETSARVAGLDLGAVDYVVKPFTSAELAARVRAALRMKLAIDALAVHARTDALTGLTRQRLDERADEAIAVALRDRRPLACLMLDVDRFREVNDSLGHLGGDRVLREIGSALRAVTRTSDVIGRFGGDEFLLLLPDTTTQQAKRVARRICRELEQRSIRVGTSIRVSLGSAELRADAATREALYESADRALYEEKRATGAEARAADAGPPRVRVLVSESRSRER